MSYIIKSTSPFVSVKLTEKGRESLSKGELNFSYWAIGDTELNYEREAIVDANPTSITLSATSRILRPLDRQPDLKSFITTETAEPLTEINASNINVVKAIVNNSATERGFFSGSSLIYTTLTGSPYTQSYTSPLNSTITGGTTLYISSANTVNIGDIIRIKATNDAATSSPLENQEPIPNLWFKVQSTATTGTNIAITVDRNLPNLSTQVSSNSYIFIYKGGEVENAFGYDTSSAYWDSGTLSFDSATNINCDDVKVWNMNNVWCENLAGITGLSTTNLYENYTKFGSYDYLGLKNPYLEYLCSTTDTSVFECNGSGYSYPDTANKSISILHYSNNTISNLYGEFFYIDSLNNKNLRITIPDIMYHRSDYVTKSGTTMGMSFITSGESKTIVDTDIEYYDLYEDPTLIGSLTPKVVGKVLPQSKIVIIDNDEIVAAISYKSNRNWTLPTLSATLTAPIGGPSTGVLNINETMYLTYALDNTSGTGLTSTLPCQTYIKVTNTSSGPKDVMFRIEDVDLLPYMRKIEDISYDGYGFYATNFKLVYQIVPDQNQRPDPSAWKVYDFTTTGLTTNTNETIDPVALENQDSIANSFILTSAINISATTFDITQSLSMAANLTPSLLQFGDERFFYGNLETYIGATIYKTIFDIRVNSNQYNQTTNTTRSSNPSTNPPNIKISEVGIYDSNKELIIIGKLSTPVSLTNNTIMLELSLDF
jgi:hypothetical protein